MYNLYFSFLRRVKVFPNLDRCVGLYLEMINKESLGNKEFVAHFKISLVRAPSSLYRYTAPRWAQEETGGTLFCVFPCQSVFVLPEHFFCMSADISVPFTNTTLDSGRILHGMTWDFASGHYQHIGPGGHKVLLINYVLMIMSVQNDFSLCVQFFLIRIYMSTCGVLDAKDTSHSPLYSQLSMPRQSYTPREEYDIVGLNNQGMHFIFIICFFSFSLSLSLSPLFYCFLLLFLLF
jgi:hypothetical protein